MKKKFEIKFMSIILTFLIFGILDYIARYIDPDWIENITVFDLFILVGGLVVSINFLLLKKWRYLLISLAIFVLIFCRSAIYLRLVIFTILAFLFVGQLILGFCWKPAQKWGLLVFYLVSGAIIAIVGQVVDYLTRADAAATAVDIGTPYGDYGISGSGYDQEESYNNAKGD